MVNRRLLMDYLGLGLYWLRCILVIGLIAFGILIFYRVFISPVLTTSPLIHVNSTGNGPVRLFDLSF